MRLKIGRSKSAIGENAVTDAELDEVKSKLERNVNKYWNKKLKLKVADPICGEKIFDIVYTATWVEDGEHYFFNVRKNIDKAYAQKNIVEVGLNTKRWTYAHEYAHCVGIPDEYSYSITKEFVRYIRPDGTFSDPMEALANGKNRPPFERNIMSDSRSGSVKMFHGWNIAISAQKILSKHTG